MFEYDSLGRLIRSVEYAYTYSGNTVKCTMVQRTEHSYDTENRLSAQSWTVGKTNYSEGYSYSKDDGSLTEMTTAVGSSIGYAYDNLKRLKKMTVTDAGEATVLNTAYAYRTISGSRSSAQVEFRNVRLGTSGSILEGKKYTYDALGNIIGIYESTPTNGVYRQLFAYTYDAQNQLTEEKCYSYEDDETTTPSITTYTYTYDAGGNILSESNGYGVTREYAYDNDQWADLLTAYDGKMIAYEGQNYSSTWNTVMGSAKSGNPISYYNGARWDFTWDNSRSLAQSFNLSKLFDVPSGRSEIETTVSYTYDSSGIRTGRTVQTDTYRFRPIGTGGGEIMSMSMDGTAETNIVIDTSERYLYRSSTVRHNYVTQNGKVVRETIGSGSTAKILDFIYDESGRPFALKYSSNGGSTFTTYYYILNLQGDVVKLVQILASPSGIQEYSEVASYTYDAWGNILSSTGNMADINPLRYRGYYYDTETGFYYLQSRYYDPVTHRFINADSYASTGQGFIGINMFSYCNNNPVNRTDESGNASELFEELIRRCKRIYTKYIMPKRKEYSFAYWVMYSDEERMQILQNHMVETASGLGIEDVPEMVYSSIPPDAYGGVIFGAYFDDGNVMIINSYILVNASPEDSYELLATVRHEMYHAYQYRVMDGRITGTNLVLKYLWQAGTKNYVDPSVNFNAYYWNPLEIFARVFAQQE